MTEDSKQAASGAKKLIDLLNEWKSLALLLGGFLTAIVDVYNQLSKVGSVATPWPPYLFSIVLIGLALFFYVRSRDASVSRLIDPEALKLDPQSPDQLIGRRDDLRRLLNAASNSMVFLVGESGCGKSALLRAGVCQDEDFKKRFLPIYIDMSGLDWEAGPLRALREELSRSLPAEDAARNAISASSKAETYWSVFSEYNRRSGRRPLLLLDQFDDYQADPRHRSRFLPDETRIWRRPPDIARSNGFWRVLRECLKNDAASIIVACRDDAAKGLESIRFFADVPQFDLPRLERGLVRLVIDRLTGRPNVIANPDGGWTAMRDRLADALESRGDLLPQQLKVVLGDLRTLPRLTLAAYARAGRVSGLEVAFVSGALSKAARIAALRDDSAILLMVIALVDRTRQPPDKGPPLTTEQLVEKAALAVDTAGRALAQLERDEVVRKQGDAAPGSIAWQLDHAYLASPILSIERERNRWRLLLEERAKAHMESSGLRVWETLLPLPTQVQLLWARLTTPFRYGPYCSYALVSLVRVLPAFAIVGLVVGLTWTALEFDTAQRIERNLLYYGAGETLNESIVDGLQELSHSSPITRRRLASHLFETEPGALCFSRHPQEILRAFVRLDHERLNQLVRAYVTWTNLAHLNEDIRLAAGALLAAAPFPVLTHETQETAEEALFDSLSSYSKIDFQAIPSGIHSLLSIHPEEDTSVYRWFVSLREAMLKIGDSDQFGALGQAYADVAARLKEGDPRAAEELASLREAILKTSDSNQFDTLGQAYADVAARLKEGDPRAAQELASLREAMLKTGDPYQLGALGQAYAAVAARLTEGNPRAAEVLASLREAIFKTDDSGQLGALRAYAAVAARLKEGDPRAVEVLASLREAIFKTDDSGQLGALGLAYAAVAARLKEGDPHAAEVLASLREAILKTESPNQSGELGRAYVAVAARLKEGDPRAAEVLASLREAMPGAPTFELDALGQAYADVAARLKEGDPRAAEELASLREAMPGAPTFELGALRRAYAAVAARLKEGDPRAAEVLASLREAMLKRVDPDQLGALGQAYAAVTKRAGRGSVQPRDFAVLLLSLHRLRSKDQCRTFASALREVSQPHHSPLKWKEVGYIYVAALLEPVCAGEATKAFVDDYWEIINSSSDIPEHSKPKEKWAGDVWAFAKWAEKNLPSFDKHEPSVGFLPNVIPQGEK
jgi:hypothetical protein